MQIQSIRLIPYTSLIMPFPRPLPPNVLVPAHFSSILPLANGLLSSQPTHPSAFTSPNHSRFFFIQVSCFGSNFSYSSRLPPHITITSGLLSGKIQIGDPHLPQNLRREIMPLPFLSLPYVEALPSPEVKRKPSCGKNRLDWKALPVSSERH